MKVIHKNFLFFIPKCHGGLQWRPVRCLHNYKGRDYEIRLKHCAVQLGPKPPEYKDCP